MWSEPILTSLQRGIADEHLHMLSLDLTPHGSLLSRLEMATLGWIFAQQVDTSWAV